MKIKISTVTYLNVEIDGAPVRYQFEVESTWNGLVKLKSVGGPVQSIIMKQPPRPGNPYDFLHPLFGGNEGGGAPKTVETECISHDISDLKVRRPHND